MVKTNKNYIIMPNSIFTSGVSLNAIGIYGIILDSSNNLEITPENLLGKSKDDIETIKEGLEELKDKGVLIFDETKYILTDIFGE